MSMDTITQVQSFRAEFTEYVKELQKRANPDNLKALADIREFDVNILQQLGVFYLRDQVDMIVPRFISRLQDFGVISSANQKPIYDSRYVIPFYDMEGLVCGLAGYSLTSKERYLYATPKYFERRDAIYGIEEYEKCIRDGYVFVVEGLTDRIALMNLGIENVMATAGAHKSPHMMSVLSMIKNVIFIPDRDKVGDLTKEYWKTNRYIRVYIPILYKDIDEYIKKYNDKMYIRQMLLDLKDEVISSDYINGTEVSIR